MNKNNSENNMSGFYLEKKLRDGNPDLFKRMNDSIAVLNNMLGKYTVRFPGYTDHSMFHSLDIIEYCNEIIGDDQVGKLSPDECYVLIMASYLHDIGMGINNEDYLSFSKVLEKTVPGFIEDSHDEANKVRIYHHEYSALFIDKYSDLFDIPDESYKKAIIQIARGHRKKDLFDNIEYSDIKVSSGIIRTAYLSAVLRLADEIDVASSRNPELLFKSTISENENQEKIFGIHESIQVVEISGDMIVLYSRPKSPEYIPMIWNLSQKIQDNLDYCRKVAEERSDLKIYQTKVVIKPERESCNNNQEGFSWFKV